MNTNDIEIQKIFKDNKLNDLKRFLKKRECLNTCNIYMLYSFYIVQSVGILTSSIGASFSDQRLIWCGVSLNMIASIIQIYEKINDNQLKKLFNNIQNIKNDKYIDESAMIDIESNNTPQNDNKSSLKMEKLYKDHDMNNYKTFS